MLIAAAGLVFVLLLAFANGANDNFKGVATLYGSGTTTYPRALAWATLTTAGGSIAAIVLARGLLAAFSGKGLVPDELAARPEFALAVAFAASGTVLLATRLGFPISTTHALVGGLIGAGLAAAPGGVNLGKLGGAFVLPLLFSPAISLGLATAAYPPASFWRRRLGIERSSCVCAGVESPVACMAGAGEGAYALREAVAAPTVSLGSMENCQVRYDGRLLGITAQSAVDVVHFLSAGAVSFARGLNDTPKIAAILLAAGGLGDAPSILAVAVVMALGGMVFARRVAETISHKVTDMNAGQGLVANLITAGLVIVASRQGLPVSTTHVSLGAIFGIGAITGRARWRTILTILLAWVTTLPLAAALGAAAYLALSGRVPPSPAVGF